MLLVWGHLLGTDSLQFGFKAETSTTQCSWLVQKVVGHYLRNGTNPIMTVLDCSKAFDTCMFGTMFNKLLDTGLPPIVIRTMMVVYEQQYAWVKWGVFRRLNITNGTRQGSVARPVLWCVYLDLLIKELRELGLGCHVGCIFMGVVVFADDVLLWTWDKSSVQFLDYCSKVVLGCTKGQTDLPGTAGTCLWSDQCQGHGKVCQLLQRVEEVFLP